MSATVSLRPLAELPAGEARGLRGIFCDLDDTITHAGTVVPEAYAALCDAAKAGLRVVVVTGRPCGWGEVLAALWPVAAVIAEGGGGAALPGGQWLWWDDEETRRRQRARLAALVDDVHARLPWARLARDHALRRVDVAFDIGEAERATPAELDALLAAFRAHGARTQVSTVHAHAIYGEYDKAKMAVRVGAALWGEPPEAVQSDYLFVGDSPNDQAGFSFFAHTAGVANVARYAAVLDPPPRYVAGGAGGHGFAEIVGALLARR